MKTIAKFLLAIIITSTSMLAANAQHQSKGKLEVNTRLTETEGSYTQRKLYREFLAEYMKDCPYISNFSVREAVGASDNHEVVWTYDVNSWDDITRFYSWINGKIKSRTDDGLKKALTPFKPDYALGGRIKVTERGKGALARD